MKIIFQTFNVQAWIFVISICEAEQLVPKVIKLHRVAI